MAHFQQTCMEEAHISGLLLSLSLSQAYVKMKDMRMRTLSRTIMVIIHMDALPRGYKGVVIVLHYMKNMCDWTQSASAERSGEW